MSAVQAWGPTVLILLAIVTGIVPLWVQIAGIRDRLGKIEGRLDTQETLEDRL